MLLDFLRRVKAGESVDSDMRFSIVEFTCISLRDLYSLGFGNWDDSGLILVPLWAYRYIADGNELVCINGNVVTKGKDEIDLDTRGGCLAYGFRKREKVA